MKSEYTMSDFIKEYKLGVSVKDSAATRLIARRLTELGYRRVYKREPGGNSRPIWVKTEKHDLLKAKLDRIGQEELNGKLP